MLKDDFEADMPVPAETPEGRISFAQQGEDLVLRRILNRALELRPSDGGTYVDCGAYHPTRDSVTRFLADAGWRGMVIDIAPAAIAAFRRDRPDAIALCCAVGAEDGETEGYFFGDRSVVNTCDAEFARGIAERHGRQMKVRKVPMRTLAGLLSEHGIDTVDVLNIDVEGFEEDVLRGIDFDAVAIRCIVIEIHGRTLTDVTRTAAYRLLAAQGYLHVASTVITHFFVRPEDLPE